MKITKFILILIVGIAVMGLSTTGFAWVETGRPDEYMEEEFEVVEKEEFVAEPEYEAEPIEEDEYMIEEERVEPVKGEDWDEHDIPELY